MTKRQVPALVFCAAMLTTGVLTGCGQDLDTFDGPEGWYALQSDTCSRALPAGSLGEHFTLDKAAPAPPFDAPGNPPSTMMTCTGHPTGPGDTQWTITVRMKVYRVAGAACADTEVRRATETAPEPTRSVAYGPFRLLGPKGYRVHQFGTAGSNSYRYLVFFCDGNLDMNVDLQLDKGTTPKDVQDVAETAVHGLARVARDAVRKEDFTARPRVDVNGNRCQDSTCY